MAPMNSTIEEIEEAILDSEEYNNPIGALLAKKYGFPLDTVHEIVSKFYGNGITMPPSTYKQYQQDVINYLKSLGKVEKELLGIKI